MTLWQVALGVLAALGTILGAYGTYKSGRATEHKSVAEVYGEALDRLDNRLKAAERRIDEQDERLKEQGAKLTQQADKIATLESELAGERAHSHRQDKEIRALRSIVHAWAQWGADLVQNWDQIRLSERAPSLPNLPPEGPVGGEYPA